MLTIRMQRTGRSGHAQYRVIVQDSRFSPTSGRVVAYLGSYNPHTKEAILDGEKTTGYLNNGAQPSERVARLLKNQGLKLPDWVAQPTKKDKSIRNELKLRRNRPAEAVTKAPEPEAEPVADTADVEAETTPTEAETVETPTEQTETPAETPAEAPTEQTEAPAEEIATEEVVEPVETPAEPEVEAPAEPAAVKTPTDSAEPAPKNK